MASGKYCGEPGVYLKYRFQGQAWTMPHHPRVLILVIGPFIKSVAQSMCYLDKWASESASKTYRYVIVPEQVGRLLIPPFKVEVGNTQFQTRSNKNDELKTII